MNSHTPIDPPQLTETGPLDPIPARPLRVLIVDDSLLDTELMLHELHFAGIECLAERVDTEPAFRAALDRFKPDVLLIDYRLPRFDGPSALSIAHATNRALPVIFVSGSIGEEQAVELLKQGATDYVLKDRLDRLPLAVRRALREVAERAARRRAQQDLRLLNQQLEVRVAERTLELNEKNRLFEEELRMARELQIAMLPHLFPTIPRGVPPEHSAVRFLSYFHPAGSVSGDSFDVIPVSDTAVGVFICDVMGHDVRAALVTAMLRALVEKLSQTTPEPGPLLTQVNRDLRSVLRQIDTTMFATALYVVADPGRGQMFMANAAHPAPLCVHLPRGAAESVDTNGDTGPALGLFQEAIYKTSCRPIGPGDFVMFFTDGLFEVEDPESHESFSQRRLLDAARRRARLPAPQLFEALIGEILAFSRRPEFDDDVCLLGMEFTAAQAPTSAAR